MDHWNYRLLFNGAADPEDAEWWVGEVYYNGAGDPVAWSGTMGPQGSSLEELEHDLLRMKNALEEGALVEAPDNRRLVTLEEWMKVENV